MLKWPREFEILDKEREVNDKENDLIKSTQNNK